MCPIYRKIKKDFNSFYRAAFFNFLENLLGNYNDPNKKKLIKMILLDIKNKNINILVCD